MDYGGGQGQEVGQLHPHQQPMLLKSCAKICRAVEVQEEFWSKITSYLLVRTDNKIKNYWNTHIKKKLRKMGIGPVTRKPLPSVPPDEPSQQQ
ncbi:hypothetical protein ZIOFF_043077 [Zingiber officinale]|uniref:HTH myb-type domain-containing protein n=1 Tax=Zingiber officinale TaxID=94328 RepID=A0A8J5G2U1_ZINOF|nr:hypothetical protein ZIOFF_043077 [Zingiber officinale]